MEIIKGIYTSATLHLADNPKTGIEPYAKSQIAMLCDNESLKGSEIVVMPDVHPGKVGTIGFTATVGERLMPLLLGIDIGCGMTAAHISRGRKEWQKLDAVIRETVPSGQAVRKKAHSLAPSFDFNALSCRAHIQQEKAVLSLGSLGGGNHFIEVDTDGEDLYLVVHSGSRHLGKELTDHYMSEGSRYLKSTGNDVPYELTWIEGSLMDEYVHDVEIARQFAALNRHIIIQEILKGMRWKSDNIWDCPHNYISSDNVTRLIFGKPLLRKGAISALKDERVIIPINMRDGIILGHGLANKEWNCSAPHGAGRILKRSNVKSSYTLTAYKKQMEGIYSSCIGNDTLDEAPFAYRSLDDIVGAIGETVRIEKILHPLYNYKAGSR